MLGPEQDLSASIWNLKLFLCQVPGVEFWYTQQAWDINILIKKKAACIHDMKLDPS